MFSENDVRSMETTGRGSQCLSSIVHKFSDITASVPCSVTMKMNCAAVHNAYSTMWKKKPDKNVSLHPCYNVESCRQKE